MLAIGSNIHKYIPMLYEDLKSRLNHYSDTDIDHALLLLRHNKQIEFDRLNNPGISITAKGIDDYLSDFYFSRYREGKTSLDKIIKASPILTICIGVITTVVGSNIIEPLQKQSSQAPIELSFPITLPVHRELTDTLIQVNTPKDTQSHSIPNYKGSSLSKRTDALNFSVLPR